MLPREAVLHYAEALFVGEPGIILSGEYDPDQHWLSFMKGTMLRKLAEPARPPRPRKVPHRQHASCPNECRDVYLCGEIHPDQGVLPFSEMRWVGTNKWTKLTKAGHPGWARRANGDLLWVRYTAGRGQEVTDWCNENCTGRYHIEIKHTMVCFQNSRDATLARLMFER